MITLAIRFTDQEAAERYAAFRKYGAWMSPAESRLRDTAEALGLTVLPSKPQPRSGKKK